MSLRTLVLAGAAALILAPAALAKGPISATISGPGDGGGGGATIGGNGEGGNSTALGRLVDAAGFFPATFGQTPDPTTPVRPAGELGPRYRITYVVPGPNNEQDTLVQHVYPHAEPAAVSYMRPGQPFFGTERTHGGWFVGGDALEQVVLGAVAPGTVANDPAPSTPSDGPWPAVAALALALATAGVFLVAYRHRAEVQAR
jgi:hypothetical protein